MAVYTPENHVQIQEAVMTALADKQSLCIEGRTSKSGLGYMVQADHRLSMKNCSGIIDYQPEELVLTARAGTPLSLIEAELSAQNQMLAFEPLYIGAFYGQDDNGTLGGLVATNLSGPRRISAGAVRDYVLGFDAVSGRGGYFRSGSKVMKNVTGYDLSKLVCGSFGQLCVLCDITLKVLPAPESAKSIVVDCESLEAARRVLMTSFGAAVEPSGGAVEKKAADDRYRAVIRIEGVGVSVNDRIASLKGLVGKSAPAAILDEQQSAEFWTGMRNLSFIDSHAEQVWKLSVTPSRAPAIISAVARNHLIEVTLDWAGGLVWLSGAGAGLGTDIRSAVEKNGGGHATLMRANDSAGSPGAVFQPQPAAIQALERRIKSAFDPEYILNPGKTAKTGAAKTGGNDADTF